jgi:TolB-like protein
MRIADVFKQLRERRVIRAAVIYVALLWAVLQAADLFAGAGIVSEATVRWLILAGVAGFPVVIIASWFLESPWRERRWIAVFGDVLVIVAVGLAAALFSWQQWFASFSRPAIAVTHIEATDTSSETADLADHLAKRFRMALSTRPEMRVIDTDSSLHSSLATESVEMRAEALGVQYLLSGTLSRSDEILRLSMQLFGSEGQLLWSERFEDRLRDQEQLQNRVIADLWPELPVSAEALADVRDIVAGCEYPADPDAIWALVRAGHRSVDPASLGTFVEATDDAGLLHLEQARLYFARLDELPPPQRPVVHQLAMQALAQAATTCPTHPDVELLRLANTLELQEHEVADYIARHPNTAFLYLARAEKIVDDRNRAQALVDEALLVDPLGEATQCRVVQLLESRDSSDVCP